MDGKTDKTDAARVSYIRRGTGRSEGFQGATNWT